MTIQIEELLQDAHEQWLQHPVTKQFLKALDKHHSVFVRDTESKSADFSIDKDFFRTNAACMNTVRKVKRIATHFKEFKELL